MTRPKLQPKNPFQITSPEDMLAKDVMSLFVEVYTDFPKIIDPGHVFLIGPRGSGKSMMYRYLMPDCQCLKHGCTLKELPFLSIYVPLKNTNLALAELDRLENRHANDVLNSHLLTTHFALLAFKMLNELTVKTEKQYLPVTEAFFSESFVPLVRRSSWKSDFQNVKKFNSVSEVFATMEDICRTLYRDVINYITRLSFIQNIVPYEGALCDYLDFLYPILCDLRNLPYMPQGAVYLLIDDAHNLSHTQASVLNSWVATRTSSKVSLKVSTQPGYETYFTTSGSTIDTPHDFSEVNISTIYTGSRKNKYRDRVEAVIKKRLKLVDIDVSASGFFPEDEEQEKEIRRLAEKYKTDHQSGKGRGYRPSDDAVRYARPDYIRSLAGPHKQSHSYSYAGFEQLVHLSSGVIRYFIEPAHKMFSETLAKYPPKKPEDAITHIPPGIQSDVVRDEAVRFLFDDLEKLEEDKSKMAPPKELLRKLDNLIQGLGGMFRQCLISDRSERRVFSIAFSDTPSEDVLEVLDLGVRLGYFHRSTIGRKDSQSGGRTRLYILSRRLSPIWTLDPTGFAGYLFITNDLVKEAMREPTTLLRRLAAKGIDSEVKPGQMSLF